MYNRDRWIFSNSIETEYKFVTDESTTENSTTTNMAEAVKELNNDITVE